MYKIVVVQLASRFIAGCWIVFIVVWFVAAWFAKRTVERSNRWMRWIVWIVAGLLLLSTRGGWLAAAAGSTSFWRTTPDLAIIASVVTAAGLSIALWARAVLGGNWSGVIVLKEQHELIDRGPYAFVRHPIYTGVLMMVLGAVIFWGTRTVVILFPAMVAGLLVKGWREERLLTKHFPEAYPLYRTRVRARLIPFVL